MKPERDARTGAGAFLSQPDRLTHHAYSEPTWNSGARCSKRCVVSGGEAGDRVCDCIAIIRLSILDRIFGPEPPTPADLEREADHERLVGAFPAAGEAVNDKILARQNSRSD
jgi:hypothetical protein